MATEANLNPQAPTPKDGGTEPQVTKIEFTAEQQQAIQGFIDKAVGRATAPLKAELETKTTTLSTLQGELSDAKKVADRAAGRGKNTADEDARVGELERQLDEFKRVGESNKTAAEQARAQAEAHKREAEQVKTELLNTRKSVALSSAAQKHSFINTDVVLKLTQDSVKWDDQQNRYVVNGADGRERMNSSYEPMTLDEFYSEFADQNKYLVRGDVRPGTGSHESARSGLNGQRYEVAQIFGPKSSSVLAMKLYKDDVKTYKAMKEQAKAQGLIA